MFKFGVKICWLGAEQNAQYNRVNETKSDTVNVGLVLAIIIGLIASGLIFYILSYIRNHPQPKGKCSTDNKV